MAKCQVCNEGECRYTCPRCGLRYCRLECYREHSSGCVNAFYKSNVEEELKATTASEETKGEMVEILKRLAFDSSSGADLEDLEEVESSRETARSRHLLSEETLRALGEAFSRGVDLDSEEGVDLVRSLMTEEEHAAFNDAALSGELSHLVEERSPWWTTRAAMDMRCSSDGTSLVKEIAVEEDARGAERAGLEGPRDLDHQDDGAGQVPPLPSRGLPRLSEIARKPPSIHLPCHLVSIVYAYCFVDRMRNHCLFGSSRQARAQAAEEIYLISPVLQLGPSDAKIVMPSSPSQGMTACMDRILDPRSSLGFDCTRGYCLEVCGDVRALVGLGRAGVLCALEEVRGLMAAAVGVRKKGDRGRREYRLLGQKMGYFLAWANEQSDDMFASLADLSTLHM